MFNIVLITKYGELTEKSCRSFNPDSFFRQCGNSSSNNFKLIHTFIFSNHLVSVYSKDAGQENKINKYEMPPPIDEKFLFGNIGLVCHSDFDDNNIPVGIMDYSKSNWEKDYETIFGGFHDLGNDESEDEDEDELETVPKELKTKSGYLKNEFIVSDSESDSDADFEYTDSDT